ncbi:MAG: hypothetical protein CMJ64_28905 [Planctomycetaceae bacterium]|nr:hypothetical protein [Planctomycetaceae bacterium]
MTQPLYAKCLAPDIANGNVFPAIRGRKIDFYCKGQKLCSFTGNVFQSNIAYLAAFEKRPTGEITEEQFRSLKVCRSFQDGYKQIKTNLKLHKQPESGEVFKLCEKFSSFKDRKPPVISVIDIELSLESQNTERSQDRIDVVLFHRTLQQLWFCEVKTLDNSEIWPRNGKVKVRDQISRYRDQLKRRQKKLLKSYQQYVRLMNKLCGVSLPEPKHIDIKVDLILFGFNRKQLSTIKDVLIPAFNGEFVCHRIGSANSVSSETLKKWWNNR